MKKTIIFLALLVFLSIGGLAVAQTQNDETQIADIPFDFYAGGERLPAGNYTIGIDVETQIITLSDNSGQHRMFLMAVAAGDGGDQSELVFQHSGNTYALDELKSDMIDLSFRTRIPDSALESRVASPVEVALNRM